MGGGGVNPQSLDSPPSDEVRDAIRAFAERYNAEWLIEKNGHRSPLNMRHTWLERTFRRAA